MTPVALNEWVSAASRGDETDFARIVDETRTLVCSIALATTRNAEASEDVAQEVYLAAWRDLRKLRNAASFLPWLRQITRNHAAQVVRQNIRERSRRAITDADTMLATAVDPSPSSSKRLIAEEDAALLEECLAALPDDAREIVTLYYREGQSTKQVAALLDLSEPAIRKRLSRAREGLREAMLERLGTSIARTAPTTAFTAGVMAAFAVGAPSTAAEPQVLQECSPRSRRRRVRSPQCCSCCQDLWGGSWAACLVSTLGCVGPSEPPLTQRRSMHSSSSVRREWERLSSR